MITALVVFLALAVGSQAALRLVGGPTLTPQECIRQGAWLRQGRAPVTVERAGSGYWGPEASW
jgi:hypothetical protein